MYASESIEHLQMLLKEEKEKNKILTEALEKINSLVANSGEKMGNDLLYEIKYTALTTLNQTKNN